MNAVTPPSAAEIFGAAPAPSDDRLPLAAVADLSALDALDVDAMPEAIEAALVALRASLPADLDALSRETIRATIRARHRQIPARMVDAAVAPPPRASSSTAESPAPPAAPSLVSDDAPWPEPVELPVLLDATAAAIRRYVVMTPRQADACALYVATAFAIDHLQIMAILLVTAATMRSGKSTLALVLLHLLPRAILLSSITAPVLFRLIDQYRPSLIADEADTWLTDEKSELRGVFNCGQTRRAAIVARCVGDTHELKLFNVFSAKVLSMIGEPPATITDRSISISLRRKRSDETVERLRIDRIEIAMVPLRRQWRRWSDDHGPRLRSADPSMPTALHDRASDNWRALVAVGDLASPAWGQRARQAALEVAGAAAMDDESVDVTLLRDCRDVFGDRSYVSTADLTKALVELSDRPWAEWSSGRAMTAIKLAKRLRPFGIRPVKERVPPSGRPTNIYLRQPFVDAWGRYLPLDSEQTEQASKDGPISQLPDSEHSAGVPTAESTISSMNTGFVPTVPTQNGFLAGGPEGEGDDVVYE